MAPRVAVLMFQLRSTGFSTSWPACTPACMRALCALADTLAISYIVFAVSDSGYGALTVFAVSQLTFSCTRTSIVAMHIVCKPWFNVVRLRVILTSSAVLSAALLLSCAYSTQLLREEYRPDDRSVAPLAYVAVLSLYSFGNLVLSFVVQQGRIDYQPNVFPPDIQSTPEDLLTLENVTLNTLIVEDLRVKVDSALDAINSDICCFCLCEMLPGEIVSELVCHHSYHTSCLKDWEALCRKDRRSMCCPLRCDMRSVARLEDSDLEAEEASSPSALVI
eukprot:TRINITY_DN25727_c0_g1_i1.p1 TRINITY_DN25727_c0_g1~~TRINITY_DN25727_c0_g1_i1.p1  ORF type:complete len:299 (-),score=9.67 TRINITY_DN25727_c0_g1_i1:341-1171(-)